MNAMILAEPTVLTTQTIPRGSLKEKLLSDVMILGMQAQYHTNRCVFVEFLGHVDTLNISIRKDPVNYLHELITCTIRLVPYAFFTDIQKLNYEMDLVLTLEQVKDQLNILIETGEINAEVFYQLPLCTIRS